LILSIAMLDKFAPDLGKASIGCPWHGLAVNGTLYDSPGGSVLKTGLTQEDSDREYSATQLVKVPGLDAESGAPLEREFGYFHLAGSVGMIQKPASPGEHESDGIQIMFEDNTFADGTSTVFGDITEGLEDLKAAIQSAEADTTFTVTSATIL